MGRQLQRLQPAVCTDSDGAALRIENGDRLRERCRKAEDLVSFVYPIVQYDSQTSNGRDEGA